MSVFFSHRVSGSSWKSSGYLGKAKMKSLLFVSIIEGLENIIMTATDKVIIGNLIGSDAMSGIVLVTPVFGFITIFEMLVGSGSSILYTRAIGNYDTEKSRKVLGMASIIAIIFGVLFSLSSFLFGEAYFVSTNAVGVVLEYGKQYFYFYRFTFLINPLLATLEEVLYIDGDESRVLLSTLSLLFGNALLSFLLIPKMGVLGASLGSAIGTTLSFIIVLSHFFSKKYWLIPIPYFNLNEFKEMILIGGTDAVNSAFDSFYSFLLNILVINMFGAQYLAILAVTEVLYEMMASASGINEAMKTMLISYRGDKNHQAMKSLMLYSIKVTLVLGVIFMIIIWIASPVIPGLYGIKVQEIQEFAKWALRLTSVSTTAFIFFNIFMEYYLDIGKYSLQILGNFLDSLFIRILLNISLGAMFGAIGIWISEGICTYVSISAVMLVVYKKYGYDKFPFLLEDNSKNSINLSYHTVVEEILDARNKAETFLEERKYSSRTIKLAILFIEEIGLLIKTINDNDDDLHIDMFINTTIKEITIIIWFDGKIIDMTDSDILPPSMSTYIVSSLLTELDKKKYQQTAGYNRAMFVIPS